jgi:hypothetical protein
MKTYRVLAYRRQLVQTFVRAHDDETACDIAMTSTQEDWDVVETYEPDEWDTCEIWDELDEGI